MNERMKVMKKVLAILLLIVGLIGFATPAFAAENSMYLEVVGEPDIVFQVVPTNEEGVFDLVAVDAQNRSLIIGTEGRLTMEWKPAARSLGITVEYWNHRDATVHGLVEWSTNTQYDYTTFTCLANGMVVNLDCPLSYEKGALVTAELDAFVEDLPEGIGAIFHDISFVM